MFKDKMRSGFGLLVVFVAAVVLIAVSSLLLKGVRFDLTESKLYTLSEGTKNILAGVEEPVELTLYFSNKGTSDLPSLRTYANRVEELLREYGVLSSGKVSVTVVDPVPFSEEEDAASAAGLQGIPVGARSDEIYFGLVGRSGMAVNASGEESSESGDVSREEVIPFFQLDKESFLEYELTKMVFNLTQKKAPVLGIVSALDLNGGFDYMSRQRAPAWIVVQQMEELFELRWLTDDMEAVDPEVDILLVVHPKELPVQSQLAIDQFVLKGGNAMIFVDPVAESEQSGMGMQPGAAKSSSLPALFAQWGVEFDDQAVVGDYANSLVVSMGQGQGPVRHIGLLGLDLAAMNPDDVVVAGLESINVASAGYLKPLEGANTQFDALLTSSQESMTFSAEKYGSIQSPDELMKDFVPQGENRVLAARITGRASTAFPEGVSFEVPADIESDKSEGDSTEGVSDGGEDVEDKMETRTINPEVVTSEAINVIIVADTDILTDRLWVQVQDFFGQQIASPWADNAGFLVNALDNLSGNADLISVRSRGRFSRPFDLVDELRMKAEEKFLEQQEALQQQLTDAETQLAALEQQRQAGDQRLLTPEQERALASFQKEKLKVRKELREVQHQLDTDIEELGRNIKLVNIFLVPFLLTVGVVLLRLIASRRASYTG